MLGSVTRPFANFHLVILGLMAGTVLPGCPEDTAEDPTPDSTIGWDALTENIVGLPVASVEVCTDDSCATSDDDGEIHLELPTGESVMVVEYDMLEMHYFLTIDDSPPRPDRIMVMTQGLFDMVLDDVPDADAALGMVMVSNVFEAGHVNSIDLAGDGPYYVNQTVSGVDVNATSTSTSGLALFINVPLGEAEVTFTPPAGRTCLDTPWSQVGSGTNTSSVLVSAGVIAMTDMDCRG